ncbi:MAG: BamA/TamA family outer membrane protein, partial [Bacteroidia bacterium]|nr:BamA/TamA family outer membrane protein [Bacteroidia bacterium]
DVESITVDRIKFVATALYGIGKNFYFGGGLDLADYFKVETDSNSFIVEQNVNGQDGGTNVGLGLGGAFDKRDNRYNPSTGAYVIGTWLYYGKSFGSTFEYSKIELDARKYFNHYKKHVIAIQATTTYATTAVPFYELSMMGGEYQMRGYYKGALRDQVLVDGQIEYRMPVWKIFGLTSWIATGRVASSYHSLNMDGLWLSYGGGFRVKVDSKSNVNLRVDFGFGPNGISGVYLNFAEAF